MSEVAALLDRMRRDEAREEQQAQYERDSVAMEPEWPKLARFPVARRWRPCDIRSDYPTPCPGIRAGERYAVISFPPHSEPFNSHRWSSVRECATCSENYGRPIPEAGVSRG